MTEGPSGRKFKPVRNPRQAAYDAFTMAIRHGKDDYEVMRMTSPDATRFGDEWSRFITEEYTQHIARRRQSGIAAIAMRAEDV